MPSLVQTGAGEALYLLVSKEDLPTEYELFYFNLTSGASGRVALDHAVMLIPFQEGKLAVLVQKMDASYRIVAIDAAGKQAETALFDDPDPQYTISGMVYDKEKGRLFVATGMGIFEVADQKMVDQSVYLPELPERELNRDYHFFLAGKYVFINQKVLFESSLAQEAAAKSLRFANAGQDSAIIRGFMKENPDVRLSFDRDTYWNPREIAETLLARDSGIDIIQLYAGSGLSAIKQKKYYADLSGIAGLKEDIALMYPQIREILMDGEAIVAYPSSMTAYSWLVDGEALARMGYQAQGASMEGWMRFVEETARDFNPEEAPFTLFPPGFDRRQLISSLLKQYIGEYESADQLSFDNPVLKDILERALRLPEEIFPEASMEGSSPEAYDAGRPPLFVIDTPLSPDSHIGFFQDYRPRYVAPPVFSLQPAALGTLSVYLVNPYSNNRDTVLAFIRHCARHQEPLQRFCLEPGWNKPIPDPVFLKNIEEINQTIAELNHSLEKTDVTERPAMEAAIAAQQIRLEYARQHTWQVSEEDIASYHQLAPHITFLPHSLCFTDSSYSVTSFELYKGIDMLLSKAIDPGRFLQETQRQLDLMRWERMQ